MTRPPVPRGGVLFCPFCGESFEQVTRCPDHDLALVPWHALASSRTAAPQPDEPVARWSPRHGRGLFVASAVLTLIAFVSLPLGHVQGDARYGGSLVSLAAHGAHRLWLVPAGALALWVSTLRRRTLRSLHAARLALLVLALVPASAAAWAFEGSRQAVAQLSAQSGGGLSLVAGSGLIAVWLGALPALYAAVRLFRHRPGGRSESGR
jgi:fumarate reductase subunit D